MTLLFIVGLIALLIWAFNRDPLKQPRTQAKLYQINQQWVDFVAGHYRVAKNDAEKAGMQRMLEDLRQQGMPYPTEPVDVLQPKVPKAPDEQLQSMTVSATIPDQVSTTPKYAEPTQVRTPVDNASILLYFGAFLLVAAAGLFVAFGGASGGVRTFITAVVAAAMYGGGFWLWHTKKSLKQAGLAFIGIGIVLVPLVGLAAYGYVFQDAGRAVWLGTSLICLAVYSHALWVLKNPLLEYILIGTFVSLFESAAAIMHAPVYYYGWGLAVVGLLVQVEQLIRRGKPEFDQPSTVGANVLLPLSLLVALAMVPGHGTMQLGVSLLLASLYYGLLAWRSSGEARLNGLVAAQALFLAAIGIFAYGLEHSLPQAALALVFLSIPQLLWVLIQKGQAVENSASVMLTSLVVAVLFAGESPRSMFVAALVLAVAGVVTWLRQARNGGYQLAIAALGVAALIFGYRIVDTSEASRLVTMLLLGIAAAQLVVFYQVRNSAQDSNSWRLGFQIMYIVIMALTLALAFSTSPMVLIAIAAIISALMVPLVVHDNWSLWSTFSGLAVVVPLLGTYQKPGLFLAASLLALVWNTALSWWLTAEHNRAFSVVMWLLLPLALVHAVPTIVGDGYYAEAYAAVTVALLGLRALAVYRPRKIIHNSTGQGDWYTIGYLLASMVALITSTSGPRFLPAVICAIIALVMLVASIYVEKNAVLVSTIPALAQIGLWSTYQHGQMVPYLILSTTFAALGYGFYALAERPAVGTRAHYVQVVSLLALFVPVAIYLGGSVWWPMPWAFLLAGLAVLHYVWSRGQSQREWAGGLTLLAVFACMHFYGVRNAQAYAHVAAALLASYAYWRAQRGEAQQSDQYILLTLAVVTVPLVIQALSGTAGDLYGWWLLIEQIVIMLLGMLLAKKIMIRWGLYVALGSVLYQLRNLGWAALGVLAVFMIGLAIIRLQHIDRSKPPKLPPVN